MSEHEHGHSLMPYFWVLMALFALTGLTVAAALIDFGHPWSDVVALVIALVAVLRAWQRYRALRRALDLRDQPVRSAGRLMWQLGFYLDLLTALRRGGIPKPDWQPPRAFARDTVMSVPTPGAPS